MNKEEICDSMTVQDAVRVLKETNCYGTMDIAKSVIIKALEQKPYEDCISRAEAIKALEYELSIEADGGLDKYRTVIKDLVNAIYNTQKKAIEDLPSIQSQPKERTETHACDYISRQAVLEESNKYIEKAQSTGTKDDFISFQELIIKQLPSVTPQAEANILDKIKTEIERRCCITVGEGEPAITLYDVFQIIDKYKESEDKK